LGRAGAEKAPAVTIDATAVVRERVESWTSLAEESGTTLTASIDEDVRIRAVETALEHIVDVYLDNALSVSPEGSTLHVSLTSDGSTVTLAVTDEGPGVSEEVSLRAFDRFWRGGSSYQGSGLGLAIVKQLADASGATVSLRNRSQGGAEARAVFRS
jgi:signal transduction histidine kinase